MTRRSAFFILVIMLALLCGIGYWSWHASDVDRAQESAVRIDRFDRVLDEYVSLGSYTALHRLNTEYPMETKLLIENVLQIGRVDEANVEKKLRHYYLDSIVQVLLDEVHHQYTDVSDLEAEFAHAFDSLRARDAAFPVPHVYAQIACLRQSIVIADTLIGISLDKYLGEDFPLYPHFFTPEQRQHMKRSDIVPDAIGLYLRSLRE
ncbi:MAG: gliding motility protein GldB [Bacteroidaceae bacterium]|nr:gliding motility protein GldB [Bacteroidaceae bacterium]